jgi:hypothetical protein
MSDPVAGVMSVDGLLLMRLNPHVNIAAPAQEESILHA